MLVAKPQPTNSQSILRIGQLLYMYTWLVDIREDMASKSLAVAQSTSEDGERKSIQSTQRRGPFMALLNPGRAAWSTMRATRS